MFYKHALSSSQVKFHIDPCGGLKMYQENTVINVCLLVQLGQLKKSGLDTCYNKVVLSPLHITII